MPITNTSINSTITNINGFLNVKPTGLAVNSSSGYLDLKDTYGTYNVPTGGGTSITDGGFTFRSTKDDGTTDKNLLRIHPTGQVGIGIGTSATVPAYSLDVSGTMRVTGATTFNSLNMTGATMANASVTGTLQVNKSLDMLEKSKIKTVDYNETLFDYAPTFLAALNPVLTGFVITGLTTNSLENTFILNGTTGGISSYQGVNLTQGKYTFTLRAKGSGITIRYRPDANTDLTDNLVTLTDTYNTYSQVVTIPANVTVPYLYLHITGTTGTTFSWTSLTVEPFYDMMIGSNSLSLGSNMSVTNGSVDSRLLNTIPAYTATNGGVKPRVAFGNGVFVVCSDLGIVQVSSDGITWTASTTSFTTVSDFGGLAFGNGIFMLILKEDPSSNVWTSTDGKIWTKKNPTIIWANSLSYGNGVFLASNDWPLNSAISVDGLSWRSFSLGAAFFNSCFGNNVWIAVGYYVIDNVYFGTIRRSTDNFNTWSSPTVPTVNPHVTSWFDIAFGNGIFMITSWDNPGKLSISRDTGLTWETPITFSTNGTGKIIYVNNTWILASTNSIWFSKTDGRTWQKITIGFTPLYFSYGNNTLLSGYDYNKAIIFKNNRTDGVVTIGREGTMTNLQGKTNIPDCSLLNVNGSGTSLFKVEKTNVAYGVFTYPLVPSGTDIKNDLVVNVPTDGSINKSTEQHTFTYTTNYSVIRTIVKVTEGLSYRFTFSVKKFTGNYLRLWVYPGSGTDIEFVDVGTEYKTHSYIFKALATSVVYISFQYFTTPAKTVVVPGGSISYTHFSIEPLRSYDNTDMAMVNVNGTIDHNVPLLGGGNILHTIGNTPESSSMSTTYSRKSETVAGAISCFTITPSSTDSVGYFELTIMGSNGGTNYAFKGFFSIYNKSGDVSPLYVTPVSALFSLLDTPPVITFTSTGSVLSSTTGITSNAAGSTITLKISTSATSVNQTFIATLVSYPSINSNNELKDFTITAI
jgi:hypothetical protein